MRDTRSRIDSYPARQSCPSSSFRNVTQGLSISDHVCLNFSTRLLAVRINSIYSITIRYSVSANETESILNAGITRFTSPYLLLAIKDESHLIVEINADGSDLPSRSRCPEKEIALLTAFRSQSGLITRRWQGNTLTLSCRRPPFRQTLPRGAGGRLQFNGISAYRVGSSRRAGPAL